jgi:hypothetical protein
VHGAIVSRLAANSNIHIPTANAEATHYLPNVPDSPEYHGPPMELQPTRLMGQNSPERVRYLSPKTSERATGISTEGFRGDPGIVDSLFHRLRDERLIPSIQGYARGPYDPDLLGGLPLTEAVLVSAIAEVVNRCDSLQRRLHEAIEAS